MSGRWIDDRDTHGDVRLFCFAHAGGGSGFFRPWRKPLAPEIAVTPVVLPGREARWRELAYVRMEMLIDPLCDVMLPYLDKPFALFGHSMGAAIAYEVARRLADRRFGSPLCLFVSARRAPHLPRRQPPIYKLPTDEFLAQIELLNGTSSNLLRESALLQALLPALRADFELNDMYSPSSGPPLLVPISAFVGVGDPLASTDEMARWCELTTGEFSLRSFDGAHFYLAGAPPKVLAAIRQDIRRATRLSRPRNT
jgi:medium-chain acyl-[acyl-carrier-protein] hydrolase